MLKPWMVIGLVTFAIALFSNILRPRDIKWFRRLQRPKWLIFEKLIPVIWSLIFVCGAISAHQIWQQNPNSQETWLIMGGYVILELLIVAFSPVLLWSHNLILATAIGAIGCLWGLFLARWLTDISWQAAFLLIPYLLWGPVGSYTTWSMYQLNQAEQKAE